MQNYNEGDSPGGGLPSGLPDSWDRARLLPSSFPRQSASYRPVLAQDTYERPSRALPRSSSQGFDRVEVCGRRPSRTWSSSEGFALLESVEDEEEDRGQFMDEYNRLAKKHAIRIMSPSDLILKENQHIKSLPDRKSSWITRMLRSTSGDKPHEPPKVSKYRLQSHRSLGDIALSFMQQERNEGLKNQDVKGLIRVCGKSVFYLPDDYCPCSLVLPTCFRATAQYIVQNAETRGIFRVPGSIRMTNALYNYYCADVNDDDIASTTRCPNLPAHLECSVHDVASTFKKLLAGLNGGILGSLPLFDALVAIHSQLYGTPESTKTKQTKLRARLIALAIGTVKSRYRRELICAVFGLLSFVGRLAENTAHEDEYGQPLPTSDLMGYNALGIIFGPLLVGDLINSYSMRIADPSIGLVLVPVTPPRSKKRSKAKPVAAISTVMTVDRIYVANDITEMLIAHWREVVKDLRSLNVCRTGSKIALPPKRGWLQSSVSESHSIGQSLLYPNPPAAADLGGRNSSSSQRSLVPSRNQTNPRGQGFGIQKTLQARDSAASQVRPEFPARLLSPTTEESPTVDRIANTARKSERDPSTTPLTSRHGPREDSQLSSPKEIITGSRKPGQEIHLLPNSAIDRLPHQRPHNSAAGNPSAHDEDLGTEERPRLGQQSSDAKTTSLENVADQRSRNFDTSPEILENQVSPAQSWSLLQIKPSNYKSQPGDDHRVIQNGRRHEDDSSGTRNRRADLTRFLSPSRATLDPYLSRAEVDHTQHRGHEESDLYVDQLDDPSSSSRKERKIISQEPRDDRSQRRNGSSQSLTQMTAQKTPSSSQRLKSDQRATNSNASKKATATLERLKELAKSPTNSSPSIREKRKLRRSGSDQSPQQEDTPSPAIPFSLVPSWKKKILDQKARKNSTDDLVQINPGTSRSSRSWIKAKVGTAQTTTDRFGTPTRPGDVELSTPKQRSISKPTTGSVKAMAARFNGGGRPSPAGNSLVLSGRSKPGFVKSKPPAVESQSPGQSPGLREARESIFSSAEVSNPRRTSRPEVERQPRPDATAEGRGRNILRPSRPSRAGPDETPTRFPKFKLRPTGINLVAARKEPQGLASKPSTLEQEFDNPPSLGRMTPHREEPPVAHYISLTRPSSAASLWQQADGEQGGGSTIQLPETGSSFSITAPSPRPGSSNSLLHAQIRSLQKLLESRADEVAQLRRQLETKGSLDIGTLSEQLREAKRDCAMWRERAETAERRMAVFEKFTSKVKRLKSGADDSRGSELSQKGTRELKGTETIIHSKSFDSSSSCTNCTEDTSTYRTRLKATMRKMATKGADDGLGSSRDIEQSGFRSQDDTSVD